MRKFVFNFVLAAAISIGFSSLGSAAMVLTEAQADQIQRMVSPHIEGDTLFIDGIVDSHMYDFLSYAGSDLKNVKFVELNSLGGSNSWGLEIAKKLKALQLTTRVPNGKFCASACTYLYAAGVVRQAGKDTWFGIHGARLGAGYTTTFQGLCFLDLDDGKSQFTPNKRGCQDFLTNWYTVSMQATLDDFAFMESNGVSPQLRLTYFAMPDDPAWPDQLNVLRKPDWPLESVEAVKYGLVTELLN